MYVKKHQLALKAGYPFMLGAMLVRTCGIYIDRERQEETGMDGSTRMGVCYSLLH